jgi:two-component system, NtrC family, sensor kinase
MAMRLIASLRFVPLKLHTKTVIMISAVLLAVFAVIAYFTNLATISLSEQQEQEQTQLFAAQVADTVGYHVKHVPKAQRQTPDASLKLDWDEVREDIIDTIIKSNPELSEVRVFYQTGPNQWEEAVRLPAGAAPPSINDAREAEKEIKGIRVTSIRTLGRRKLLSAVAPIVSPLSHQGAGQIGTAAVVLSFDETVSVAAKLRRLIWPLMGLAIVAITLITYFLFRHLVYQPIDRLLLSMAQAEAGNLAQETDQQAPDEIGLLASRFDRMLNRIRQITGQLELEQNSLKARVREATSELEGRKQQLEQANRTLFELQRQLAQLESLAATGQLAAQFAHEVGTPLNLISGHVQVLRARARDERSIRRLNGVAAQIKRITQIVRSMLDSTRRPGLQLEPTDINSLLNNIFEAAQPALAAHRVELRTDLDAALPQIHVDPDQLQQVFFNLINNSLDAMPQGGVLSVASRSELSGIVIDIADTGEGIEPEQLDMIFEPLFTTKESRGTGLGMTVVQQIISEHRGTIAVESVPGKGTLFHIRLPLAWSTPVEANGGAQLETAERLTS